MSEVAAPDIISKSRIHPSARRSESPSLEHSECAISAGSSDENHDGNTY